MAKVLVIRTSSLGDVALLVPVIYSVAAKYPQDRFTVMTRQSFTPLFDHLGFNINVLPLDLQKTHGGKLGIMRILSRVLFKGYSHVADVHDVLRSKVVRSALRGTFCKVARIDKGREEKSEMIESKNTKLFLPHTTQRYLDVFDKLGFPSDISFATLFEFKPRIFSALKGVIAEKNGDWIGIAPFAKHLGKIYSLNQMEEVVASFSKRANTTIFLFGSGERELTIISEWATKYPNVVRHAGLINFEREMLLISYLDVMLSMDSANMHLASLVNVPVVSVWGATHPALGFYGYKQDIGNAIISDVDCRPCSVFGDKPCSLAEDDQYKCLSLSPSSVVIDQVEKILTKHDIEATVCYEAVGGC